jgi:hypothetical protein
VVLIKASRGVGLELVCRALSAHGPALDAATTPPRAGASTTPTRTGA